jgi:hypothetical protein
MKSLETNTQIANFCYSTVLKSLKNQCFPEDWGENVEAQNLYRQFGFESNGYRKKYYLHNGDDAILMSLIFDI